MASRLAPRVLLEAAIEELLADGIGDVETLSEIGRLGARLVLQRALEAEGAEFLNRGRYQESDRPRLTQRGPSPLDADRGR